MNTENFVNPRQSSTRSTESATQEENNNTIYECSENEEYDDINRLPEDVPVNMKTLCILSELNQIYEDRLNDIDVRAKGDSHLKYLTCMDWIEMLKRLINDLLETIGEIEYEASQRIGLLERKLETECSVTHTNEVGKLQNDLINLLKFVKRAIENDKWDLSDLNFYTLSAKDILGHYTNLESLNSVKNVKKLQSDLVAKNHEIKRLESEHHVLRTELQNKELQINNYIKKIKELENQNWKKSNYKGPLPETTVDKSLNISIGPYDTTINELKTLLEKSESQLAHTLQENECLQSELILMKSKNPQINQCIAISTSTNTTPRKFEDKSCHSISLEELRELHGTQTVTNLSQHFDDSDETITQSAYPSLDTILEVESQKLRNNHELEARYKKTLKRELDELFKIVLLNDDQRKRSEIHRNKLEELVKLLLTDFNKTYTKLNYTRRQLNKLIGSKDAVESDTESGYLSQEDMEPEFSIINSVINNYQLLKKENMELKQNIEVLKTEIEGCTSVLTEKLMIIKASDEIIKHVADILSNMCNRKTSSANCCNFVDKDACYDLEAITCLNESLVSVDNLFKGKEQIIDKLETTVDDLKKEIQCRKAKITVLEYDLENKDQKISELEEAIDKQTKINEMIECEKNNLETILEASVQKPRMEFEILYDLLGDNFAEIARLESLKVKLQDENLYLKSVIVQYENDLQALEENLKEAIALEKEFLEKENDYRNLIDDLTTEIANLSTQVTKTQEEFEIDEPLLPFEASFRELESQNDLLQNTIESLQSETIELKSNLEDKDVQIQQLQNQLILFQGIVEQKNKNYDELQCKYSNLVYVIQQQRSECTCGAANKIASDLKESACTRSKKPYELQHIFEMLDRKDDELKALKESSMNEKNRYQKHIAEQKSQIEELNFKLSVVKEDLKKRDKELEKGSVRMLEFAKRNGELISELMKYEDNIYSLDLEEKQLRDFVEKLSDEVKAIQTSRKEREAILTKDINALRQHSDEHAKALIKANKTIMALEEQAKYYRLENDAVNKENVTLRAENLSLKRDLAAQENSKKNLREELQKTQRELSNTKYIKRRN